MTGKLMFFWDFDAQWGGDNSRSVSGAKNWGLSDFTNTEKLLDYHAQFEFPVCFAVVGAVAIPGDRPYHDPQLVKKIHNAGHEIASHSMKHEWLPSLGENKLFQSLNDSKDALEQCIGSEVITFVPPYNQPFDYPAKGSISLSERKINQNLRINIPILCKTLNKVGYKFARISYANPYERLLSLLGKKIYRKANLEIINGIQTICLNGKAGFADVALTRVKKAILQDQYVVIYGHPHSISGAATQSENNLLFFFNELAQLRQESKLKTVLPRELCD